MTDGGSSRQLYALLGFMVFAWSFNFVVAKNALTEFSPLLLASLRFTLGALFVLPIYAWTRGGIRLAELAPSWRVVALGVIGIAANQFLLLLGLIRTTVAHAAILIALTPLMVLLLSAWVGHEQITTRKLTGLGLALCGIGVLQGRAAFSGHGSMLGDVFVLFAGLAFAIFTVGGKEIRARYDGLTMATMAYTGSAVVMSPVTFLLVKDFDFTRVTWVGWISLAYIATLPSVVASLIFLHALRFMPSSSVSRVAYLQPFLATLFAVPLLGEKVTPSLLTGGALVLAGVFWTERT